MACMEPPEADASPSTADAIDLRAYLERIGYADSLDPGPTLAVLGEFVERHMATIPFEAIDVLLGRGVDLAPQTIDHKLLAEARGGYCFEHASLMRRALRAIGFSVEQHLARVWVHGGLDSPTPPATHTSLKVEADGCCWLVDVGFGGFMPNEPLVWQPGSIQRTGFGAFRLRPTRDGHMLESMDQECGSPLYEILDFHCKDADFKVANHYTASHPDSPFRQGLMVVRTEQKSRTTLAGNRFKRVGIDGSRDECVLDAAGLAETLASEFGLPVAADWQPLLARIAAGDKGFV